ncbi:unnamed protein product [Echinostoma caproni]|uniref:Uncharacterized protein n=1 Tax=Echinostoma caproni TaxID=27848 RepID=A0A3P8IQG6_9TREM|nr:unnamed protein product [Echinostoma caproni]
MVLVLVVSVGVVVVMVVLVVVVVGVVVGMVFSIAQCPPDNISDLDLSENLENI